MVSFVNMIESKVAAGRRDRKREQTKAGLVKAAVKLFVRQGYDETTIDEIVAAADVAKVTFYYHFRSKEDILHEIKRNCASETSRRAEELLESGAPAREILRVLSEDITLWVEKNWQLVEVFVTQRFAPPIGKNACPTDETPPLVFLLQRIVLQGQASGDFRNELVAEEMAHFLMLGMMHQHFSWIRKGRTHESPMPGIGRWLDFVLNGLLADKTNSDAD